MQKKRNPDGAKTAYPQQKGKEDQRTKKTLGFILAFVLCLALALGEGSCESIYTAGVYEASVKGMGKDIEGNEVTPDYDIIRAGVENAENIYTWLEGYGLTTTPLMEYVYTPASRGMGLIELLNKAAEGADIRLSTRAKELIVEDGKVTGVIAEDAAGNQITFHANGGVVLATGSFSSNGEMVAKYQKIGTGLTANIPSNNPAGNRGDGIVMAEAVGAALRGKVESGPYSIARLQLAAHLTFGGLVIDRQAQVLDTNGAPIAGLYAAGDVTSGYEGIVHQTGNCLTIIINTGRIAGEKAAELAK